MLLKKSYIFPTFFWPEFLTFCCMVRNAIKHLKVKHLGLQDRKSNMAAHMLAALRTTALRLESRIFSILGLHPPGKYVLNALQMETIRTFVLSGPKYQHIIILHLLSPTPKCEFVKFALLQEFHQGQLFRPYR